MSYSACKYSLKQVICQELTPTSVYPVYVQYIYTQVFFSSIYATPFETMSQQTWIELVCKGCCSTTHIELLVQLFVGTAAAAAFLSYLHACHLLGAWRCMTSEASAADGMQKQVRGRYQCSQYIAATTVCDVQKIYRHSCFNRRDEINPQSRQTIGFELLFYIAHSDLQVATSSKKWGDHNYLI